MKHTAQSGRTMVETLGALAVMGVLSVGGLHAFSSIMDRFRANDLLDEASVRAMRVSEQIKKGRKTLSLGKFLHNETSGGTFSKQVFTEGLSKQFGIQVSNVKKAVCERLLDSITDTSPLRRLALSETPRNPLTQCQDLNSFLMIYNGGFKGESQDTEYQCETDSQCPKELTCQDGFCACPNNWKYVYTATGRESNTKKCCNPELVVGDVCCNSVENDEFTGEKLCCAYNSNINGCCPEGHFAFNNTCYPCDQADAVYMVKGAAQYQACYVCPERTVSGFTCFLECPPDQVKKNGRCYCPDDKPIQDIYGECHSCDSNQRGVWVNTTLLLLDSGWKQNVSSYCAPAGYCGNYRCANGYAWACGENQIGGMGYQNIDFILRDGTIASGSSCYDCSEVDISTIKLESQCDICGGTWDGENWFTGTCIPPQTCTDEECIAENECMRCNSEVGICEDMCQQVEYLEGTYNSGNSYIDTKIFYDWSKDFLLKVTASLPTANTRFCIIGDYGSQGINLEKSNTKLRVYGHGGTPNNYSTNDLPENHQKFNVEWTRSVSNANINVDLTTDGYSETISRTGISWDNISSATLKVFTDNRLSGTFVTPGLRIYSLYMKLGDKIIDFTPVISPDGRAAMFDQVSKKLFYNKGTGTFKTNLDE